MAANLPHLPLPQRVERKNYKGPRTPREKPQRSQNNLDDRTTHARVLESSIAGIETAWILENNKIQNTAIADFIDPTTIPIFLRIDTVSLDIELLKGFGIEIISQEEDGYIIGASVDAFDKLKNKIQSFQQDANVSTAYLWEIDNGIGWKRDRILSPDLNNKLDQLDENQTLELEFSIACNIKLGDTPTQNEGEPDLRFQRRLEKWRNKAIARDNVFYDRLDTFIEIANNYGTVKDNFQYNDSFGVRAEMSIKGLKDILYNYPYVFEIAEHDYLAGIFDGGETGQPTQAIILPPNANAPKICIIDSGIMQGHRLLAPAIDNPNSRSYVPGEPNVIADLVNGGGHGTRVAGAVLYPTGINGNGNIQLKFWLQNARILNNRNLLSDRIFLPRLMSDIVRDYSPTKIFNLSVGSNVPCKTTHMSLWAAAIDKLTWENDILFIIAVGNIYKEGNNANPGIRDFIRRGLQYPDYLLSQNNCRISNPAQSCFSLSVGSVTIGEFEDADRISFGKNYAIQPAPSPFSRTGPGLWGMIKPDVVELAGDFVREKNNNPLIVEHNDTSPHLVKSIQTSNNSTGKDKVGTSFAAPKVSSLVAHLQLEFPNESSLFYRGLVAQSARLPTNAFNAPSINHIRHFGYGIPNLDRALDNTTKRVTLYTSGNIFAKHADIYSVKIPQNLNRPGDDFAVLVEVTLSYKAMPRRTRMRTNSYLSTWLDWKSAKIGEPFDTFRERIINSPDQNDDEIEIEDELRPNQGAREYEDIEWKIRDRVNAGDIRSIKRQDNTLQKDWVIFRSNALPQEFDFAVLGHKGWGSDSQQNIPYSFFVSFEILDPAININIYEEIRVANEIELEQQINIE